MSEKKDKRRGTNSLNQVSRIIKISKELQRQVKNVIYRIEEWWQAYETDVHFPDVSGMEHLDMLLTRSKIADHDPFLTLDQQNRLYQADRTLLQQASQFYLAIASIADIANWRKHAKASRAHWWWYLDVVVHIPVMPIQPRVSYPVAIAA